MNTVYTRTYTELIQFPTFEERFNYLKLDGFIGDDTFGTYSKRWLNQQFYRSAEWLHIKREVILRDNCCDLALQGYDIPNKVKVMVHHMNPITEDDIINRTSFLLNPEFLVCVSFETHNAIHFGDINVARVAKDPVRRQPNDQCPWLNDYQVKPYATARGFERRD